MREPWRGPRPAAPVPTRPARRDRRRRGLPDGLHHRRHGHIALDLHLHADAVPRQREHRGERGDRLAATRIGRSSRAVNCARRPPRPVRRTSVASWKTTARRRATPAHQARCRPRRSASARRKAASVFSGASAEAPRWAINRGRVTKRHNNAQRNRKERMILRRGLPFWTRLRQSSRLMKVVVLCSGGMDSVTALHWARRQEEIAAVLSFDYGAKHNHREIPFASGTRAAVGAPHQVITLDL